MALYLFVVNYEIDTFLYIKIGLNPLIFLKKIPLNVEKWFTFLSKCITNVRRKSKFFWNKVASWFGFRVSALYASFVLEAVKFKFTVARFALKAAQFDIEVVYRLSIYHY